MKANLNEEKFLIEVYCYNGNHTKVSVSVSRNDFIRVINSYKNCSKNVIIDQVHDLDCDLYFTIDADGVDRLIGSVHNPRRAYL